MWVHYMYICTLFLHFGSLARPDHDGTLMYYNDCIRAVSETPEKFTIQCPIIYNSAPPKYMASILGIYQSGYKTSLRAAELEVVKSYLFAMGGDEEVRKAEQYRGWESEEQIDDKDVVKKTRNFSRIYAKIRD